MSTLPSKELDSLTVELTVTKGEYPDRVSGILDHVRSKGVNVPNDRINPVVSLVKECDPKIPTGRFRVACVWRNIDAVPSNRPYDPFTLETSDGFAGKNGYQYMPMGLIVPIVLKLGPSFLSKSKLVSITPRAEDFPVMRGLRRTLGFSLSRICEFTRTTKGNILEPTLVCPPLGNPTGQYGYAHAYCYLVHMT